MPEIPLGDIIEFVLEKYKLNIYSIEDICIKRNGNSINLSEQDLENPISKLFLDLINVELILEKRLYDENDNVINKQPVLVKKYIDYLRNREDSYLAKKYQNYYDEKIKKFSLINRNKLVNNVNRLNRTYNNLNTVNRLDTNYNNSNNNRERLINNLYEETLNYNSLLDNVFNTRQNNPPETLAMEFTMDIMSNNETNEDNNEIENKIEEEEENTSQDEENKTEDETTQQAQQEQQAQNTSINWGSSNYYTSLVNEFSNLINRNRDRPYFSGATIQYQTVPLNSYTSALNNVMGFTNVFRGINRTNNNLNEDVKIILTEKELRN